MAGHFKAFGIQHSAKAAHRKGREGRKGRKNFLRISFALFASFAVQVGLSADR
jgi:hypothetical protein